MNKEIAFASAGKGTMNNLAWASVVGCAEVDQKGALKVSLKALENKAASCNDKDAQQKLKIEAFDRDIKKLKAQLSMT